VSDSLVSDRTHLAVFHTHAATNGIFCTDIAANLNTASCTTRNRLCWSGSDPQLGVTRGVIPTIVTLRGEHHVIMISAKSHAGVRPGSEVGTHVDGALDLAPGQGVLAYAEKLLNCGRSRNRGLIRSCALCQVVTHSVDH